MTVSFQPPVFSAGAPRRVRITQASMGTRRLQRREVQFVRGTLGPQFFHDAFKPDYQRIEMDGKKRQELRAHLRAEDGDGVPDELILVLRSTVAAGVRMLAAGEIELTGPLAILDGHQRISAGRSLVDEDIECLPLEVIIYLDLTTAEEMRLFRQVNIKQTRVSSQVHLRNVATNPAIEALREMADKDEDFILCGRIQWDQRRVSNEPITARMLYEVATALHGIARKESVDELVESLRVIAKEIGTEQLVVNTKRFFAYVQQCFPDESFETSKFINKLGFLRGMALLFNEYDNFWDKRKPDLLFLPKPDARKLGKVQVDNVMDELKRSSQTAHGIARLMAHQYDKGREQNRLVRRTRTVSTTATEEHDENQEDVS